MRNVLSISIGLLMIFGCSNPSSGPVKDDSSTKVETPEARSTNVLQHLVPIPKELTINEGVFVFSEDITLVYDEGSKAATLGFQKWLQEQLGWKVVVQPHSPKADTKNALHAHTLSGAASK
ncbi:MAG: hypothetical protein AAF193_12055, partial [Bacteroidota bacterium]